MDVSESIATAFDSLLNNKLRAGLTMLGMIIGVAAVIALMGLGNGFNVYIADQIQSIGSNLVNVSTDYDNSDGFPTLTMDDVEALKDRSSAPHLLDVAAMVQSSQPVVYQTESINIPIMGVTANYFRMTNSEDVDLGNLFGQFDVDTRARVTVLGSSAAQDLFGGVYPIGQPVKINGHEYRVVGVLAPSGGAQFGADDQAYVPLTSAQIDFPNQDTRNGARSVSSILAEASSSDDTDTAILEMTKTLRKQHGLVYTPTSDFAILSQKDLLNTFGTITATLTLFLGAIAGISLLVGGIGIMNIMLVTVTERTKEIGIRKAIGALRRDVLLQFVIESLVLSLIGGIVGTLLGWGISEIVGIAIDVKAVINVGNLALANGISMGIGLASGIYPAYRASTLHPIEALRYE